MDMMDVATRAGETREPWILARDAAVIGLLYGAGLRISEALGLQRRDAAKGFDSLTVIGKGAKTRSVPVIRPVAEGIEAYLQLCPYTLKPEGPLFVGAKGGPLSPRIIQKAVERLLERAPLEHAIGILSEWYELDPNHPDACYWLGLAALKIGEVDTTRTLWTRAVERRPGFTLAEESLGLLSSR
jgi:integrase